MVFDKETFFFNGEPELLYPFIGEVLTVLEQKLPGEAVEGARLKSQMVLIEMLTNSVKHSGIKGSLISLEGSGDVLTISRSDDGTPFFLLESGAGNGVGDSISLYRDPLFSLEAVFTAPSTLHFSLTEYDLPEKIAAEHLSEHFGLMIIAKASKLFYYHYDEAARQNHYVAHIDLVEEGR